EVRADESQLSRSSCALTRLGAPAMGSASGGGVAVDEDAAELGMVQVAHLVLQLVQQLAGARVHDRLEAELMGANVLREQAPVLEKRVRPREIGDVDRHVVAIVRP